MDVNSKESLGDSRNLFDYNTDSVDIVEIFRELVEHKKLIILVVAISGLIGFFYALSVPLTYKADALLQIESKRSAVESLGLDSLQVLHSSSKQANTEIQIIKSREIIGKTVDYLGLTYNASASYFPVIGRSVARYQGDVRNQQDFDGFCCGLGKYAWNDVDIKLERLLIPKHLYNVPLILKAGINNTYDLFSDEKLLLSGHTDKAFSANGVTIFVSLLKARQGVNFQLIKHNRLSVINNLQNKIKVLEIGGNTGILKVELEGKDPEKIRKIVDTVANFYLRQNVNRTSKEAKNRLIFLQKQLPIVKAEMEATETILNNYRSNNESIDLTQETQLLLREVVDLENKLSLLKEKRTEMAKKYTDKHPVILSLIQQQQTLKGKLNKTSQQTQSLPKIQQKILRLSRDVKVSTTIYTQLLNKSQELKVAEAGIVGNVRIIDSSVVLNGVVNLTKKIIFLIALLIGLLFAILFIVTRKTLQRKIKDPDLIENKTGLPVYANIPLSITQQVMDTQKIKGQAKNPTILAEFYPQDVAIESLRSLRTSLNFSLLGAKNNRILITGPAPQIGKSFVSTNLAHTIAQSGKKVLIIDADMRKGHIHKSYKMTRSPGLSELITEQLNIDEVTRPTKFENIDIVSTGRIPPNPSELLMHNSFEKYCQKFSDCYDLILIDTPPLLAVTDAAIVAKLCAINFILLRFGKHNMHEVLLIIKRLEDNNIDVAGFIFNGIELSNSVHSKYRYYNYEYK